MSRIRNADVLFKEFHPSRSNRAAGSTFESSKKMFLPWSRSTRHRVTYMVNYMITSFRQGGRSIIYT